MGERRFRDDLLTHPNWGHANIHNLLEADMVAALVGHIADCAQHYYNGVKNRTLPMEPKQLFESSRGLLWGTGEHWGKWQARVFELRSQLDWPTMEKHFDTILSQAPYYDWPYGNGMLEHAEVALKNGIRLQPRTLLCVAYQPTHKNRAPKAALAHVPAVLAELCSEANQPQLEITALRGVHNIAWLQHFNPAINAWNLGERCSDVEMLTNMAAALHDGALFKAWHGIALSLEEMRIHPLAHALYVNKHAPVYAAEVLELPDYWRLAMELATTGAQFKSLLLQGKDKKTAESIALPEAFGT